MFEVKILYRELLYERWSGNGRRPPYVAKYPHVRAETHQEAVRIAEGQFHRTAEESGVRWHREVVEVRVRPQM